MKSELESCKALCRILFDLLEEKGPSQHNHIKTRKALKDIPLVSDKNQITKSEQNQQDPASEPEFVGLYGDSEFLREIEGRNKEDVLLIVDDLMDTLQVANPRVYNGVMRKLRSI